MARRRGQVYVTNRTMVIETRYKHTYANLMLIQKTPSGTYEAVGLDDPQTVAGQMWVTDQTIQVTNSPYGPYGSPPITNVTSKTYLTNSVVGEYYILPTNLCSIAILSVQATFTNTLTNFSISVTDTNIFIDTNNPSITTNVYSYTFNRLTYFTNHAFVALPVTCPTNTVALRQGIDKIRFERRNYDSLLGTYFEPFTNDYTLNAITNSALLPQTIRRPIFFPDLLFTADDLATGPGAIPGAAFIARNMNFSTNSAFAYPGLAGPGTIEPLISITYNKVGPIYFNASGVVYFWRFAESAHYSHAVWGSYDGSTNAPVVYPNGTSVEMIENAMLITISPPSLPDGLTGRAYSATLSATGGQPPYTWSLTPGSAGLPPGLALSPTGVISGTPGADATYDFAVRMTDSAGRYVDRPYSITINP